MIEINPNYPVNKIAALVVSRVKDVNPEFRCGDHICSLTPLPTAKFTGPPEHDLTGKKSGRFTVIGCALWRPASHKKYSNSIRWVVKCKCGRYQMMATKAVKKNHPSTACVECQKRKSNIHINQNSHA